MPYLKQHRKAEMQLEGRRLIGKFNLSLTNKGDREVLMEFMREMRKQLMVFDPEKAKTKAKKRATKKKAKKKARRR